MGLLAQAPDVIRIRAVNHPRPVTEAVEQVDKRFGWIAMYEDTAYVHPTEIVDITKETSRDPMNPKRLFGRRNGRIDIDFRRPLREGQTESQIGGLLQAITQQWNAKEPRRLSRRLGVRWRPRRAGSNQV